MLYSQPAYCKDGGLRFGRSAWLSEDDQRSQKITTFPLNLCSAGDHVSAYAFAPVMTPAFELKNTFFFFFFAKYFP